MAKLNSGKTGRATPKDMEDYEAKLRELEAELERRKELGRRFDGALLRMKEIAEADEQAREEHQVAYQTSLREGLRMMDEHSEKLQQGKMLKSDGFDMDQHRSACSRVGLLLQRMSTELTRECERVGAWGVLGQGTGGRLVAPGTREPLPKEQIIGETPQCTSWCQTWK